MLGSLSDFLPESTKCHENKLPSKLNQFLRSGFWSISHQRYKCPDPILQVRKQSPAIEAKSPVGSRAASFRPQHLPPALPKSCCSGCVSGLANVSHQPLPFRHGVASLRPPSPRGYSRCACLAIEPLGNVLARQQHSPPRRIEPCVCARPWIPAPFVPNGRNHIYFKRPVVNERALGVARAGRGRLACGEMNNCTDKSWNMLYYASV